MESEPTDFFLSLLLSLDDVQSISLVEFARDHLCPSLKTHVVDLLMMLSSLPVVVRRTLFPKRSGNMTLSGLYRAFRCYFMCHEQVKAGLAGARQISKSWKQPFLAQITNPAASVFPTISGS